MHQCRLARAALFLPIFVLSMPVILPLAARDRSKPPKVEDRDESPEIAAIVNRIIASEAQYYDKLRESSPRVETYLQYYEPEPEVGDVSRKDAYFLGRLSFGEETKEVSFVRSSFADWLKHRPDILRPHLYLNEFAVDSLVVDDKQHFDRQHYAFVPVRWEYLGDVRCLAIDVTPREPSNTGAFQGRIWVEDRNYAIVRVNGTRVHPYAFRFFLHFDCWRQNLQPGLWLPVYVFSQETNIGKRLRYKSETRLWGYDLSTRRQQQEWTDIVVDAPGPIRDNGKSTSNLSPVESERQLTLDAENNVLDRLEKARLISPPGPVDKVLETVVNNLRATNHLENLPPVHCRVMLTSTLESFSLAYTIVVSRGLIDVLPDEPSLAMVLAHELGHIALGQRLDLKYAFNDRMQVSDEKLLATLDVSRDRKEEEAADAKGIEFLKNSPYKDQLGQAGLFLRAAADAAPRDPHLFGAHLGNGLTDGNKLSRMAGLIGSAPALRPKSLDQIAALPLGSRVEVNAWGGSVAFTTRPTVPLADATEKMPFQVTPVIPFLRTYAPPPKVQVSAQK